jgi:hypothetical protein
MPVSANWKSLILFNRIILGRRNRRRTDIGENGLDKDNETVTWKTVVETTDAIFDLVFSLMLILVNILYFVDVNGHS